MPEINTEVRAPSAGAGPGKTQDGGEAALETAINKLFPEGAEDGPAKEPGTTEQPEPKGEGETTDLSQKQTEAEAEAGEAKAEGMTVAEYRAATAAEKGRTEAIIAKTGETLAEIYAREEKEGKETDLETAKPKSAAKTFSQEEIDHFIRKRTKNLQTENEDLKRQLAQRPTAATPDTFEESESATQSGIDRVDDLFESLRSEPEKVESELRKMLGDKAPAEMTAEYMRSVLRRTKRGLEGQLRDVAGQKLQFAAERQGVEKLLAEPEMIKAAACIADEENDEHAVWQQLRKSPQLKNHPRGEYLAAALLIGIRQLKPALEQIAARQAGRKPAGAPVKLKIRSKMPGTGSAAAAGKGGRMTLAQAKAKGDATAMADAMGL